MINFLTRKGNSKTKKLDNQIEMKQVHNINMLESYQDKRVPFSDQGRLKGK